MEKARRIFSSSILGCSSSPSRPSRFALSRRSAAVLTAAVGETPQSRGTEQPQHAIRVRRYNSDFKQFWGEMSDDRPAHIGEFLL